MLLAATTGKTVAQDEARNQLFQDDGGHQADVYGGLLEPPIRGVQASLHQSAEELRLHAAVAAHKVPKARLQLLHQNLSHDRGNDRQLKNELQ